MKRNVLCRKKRGEKSGRVAYFNLFWVFCMLPFVSPATLYAQGQQRITLEIKQATIEQVMNRIESDFEYGTAYRATDLPKERRDFTFRNATITEVMNKLTENTNLRWSQAGNIITISLSPASREQQPLLRGQILELDGTPLIGATVVVKGTTTGVAAGAEGRFSLPAPGNNTVLVISYIGKKPREITYTGQQDLIIRMEDEEVGIDEVVVTGIFTRKRESYTGVVTTVTARELASFRGQNLIQTLGNIDPAINIVADNLSGSDPNKLPEITIRGNSSLPTNVQEFNEGQRYNLNTPLIIMDGFEVSLQKLMDYNDEEIESISILKDASATAIYGSRGANGVIVIVSKQPTPGKLRINGRAGFDFEIPDLSSYDLLNAEEKLQLEWNNGFYHNLNPGADMSLKRRYNTIYRDVLEGTDTYWLNKPLRTGVTQRYNIRLEGGSNEFRWGVSTAYNRIAGAMKGSNRDNFTGEIILSYHYKSVIFRNQTNIGFNKAINSKHGSFSDYANMNPYWKTHDMEGNLIRTYSAVTGSSSGGSTTVNNPLYNASLNSINESSYTDIINNFSIEWSIIEGLRLRGQLGVSKQYNTSDRFTPPGNTKYLVAPYTSGDGVLRRGEYTYGNGENMNYDGNVTLSYSTMFHKIHQLYAGFDYSISQRKGYTYTFAAEGFTNEKLNSIGSAMRYAQNGSPSENETFTRRIGFTSNVNYTYDNRYYVDLSLRMDGSSQFGSNNRFAPFWSTGIGWNLHREKFLAGSNIVSNLRLRVSYGQTGSQQFSAYQALSTYAYYMSDRYGNWGGAYLRAHGNKDLKWQITDQFNVGMEFGTLENRLTASFDYYIKKTSNLLSELEVPLATGFSSYIANIGEVKNTGFEAGLGGYLIRNTERNFVWMVNTKLAYNKNEITKVSEAIKAQNEQYLQQDVDVSTLFYEGYSQNSLYVVRSQGIDPSTGQEVFIDRYGNVTDTWSPADKVYAGVNEPAYRGNLSTMFRWKELSLNLSFGYHWGGVTYNQTLISRVEMLRSAIGARNVDRRVLTDRWSQPGDYARYKKIAAMGETDIATRATSRFVMKDQVFELQSASLQYHWETAWLKNNGISSATFAMNSSELFYISTVKRERGINYPFARRVGLSVTLMF